jgi:hypothetical protein
MTWFTVGAFLALGALVANSVVIMVRQRRNPALVEQRPTLKGRLPVHMVLGMLLVVAAWVAGLGAPTFWPESAFGQFMSSTLNFVAYFIWCAVAFVVFHVVWHLVSSRQPGKNDGAV